MKAIVYTEYGSPEVLQLKEVDKPTPTDNEVLVKIHASSINDADLNQLTGKMQGPGKRPRFEIIGSDMAGRIETVGRNVKQFQPGDEIFADLSTCGFGAFAEYTCVPENVLMLKPANITFEDAATLPQAALTALQGLRKKRQIQPGEKVLINGAGGGMGTFAVQIAKSFGAEVTGVDSTEKLEVVRLIGADHVIDYTQEDYTKSGQRYDRILDLAAHRSVFDYKRVLNPKGIFGVVGGSTGTIFKILLLGPLISLFGSKKMGVVAWKPKKKEDMSFIIELLEAGKVVPVIDRRYPLNEVPEALRYFQEGHHKGKLVITME